MQYVTYAVDGTLTGAFIQDLHPDHAANYIEVGDEVYANWSAYYRVNGAMSLLPPVVVPPSVIKAAKWEDIKLERDRRESGGVKVGTNWFHSDEGSRIKQLGLVIAGASIPPDLMWKTMDGSFVNMTPTLAGQIFGASLAQTSAVFKKAEQHKAAMEASANPSAYDFSTGWPAIYGE